MPQAPAAKRPRRSPRPRPAPAPGLGVAPDAAAVAVAPHCAAISAITPGAPGAQIPPPRAASLCVPACVLQGPRGARSALVAAAQVAESWAEAVDGGGDVAAVAAAAERDLQGLVRGLWALIAPLTGEEVGGLHDALVTFLCSAASLCPADDLWGGQLPAAAAETARRALAAALATSPPPPSSAEQRRRSIATLAARCAVLHSRAQASSGARLTAFSNANALADALEHLRCASNILLSQICISTCGRGTSVTLPGQNSTAPPPPSPQDLRVAIARGDGPFAELAEQLGAGEASNVAFSATQRSGEAAGALRCAVVAVILYLEREGISGLVAPAEAVEEAAAADDDEAFPAFVDIDGTEAAAQAELEAFRKKRAELRRRRRCMVRGRLRRCCVLVDGPESTRSPRTAAAMQGVVVQESAGESESSEEEEEEGEEDEVEEDGEGSTGDE
eukprot:TRINITY_DN28066_c0_g1_i1.p1 TRINITY_DN28066_c0_g1~~TRINITY_DN28066_c0_g1_i1.p1  ORF type:complete len:473 (+),score=72.41 TRINITY_DN28066_c0_g1_i1:79-1419(+)